MIPRIYLLLAAGLLPLGAQSSLNDGGRVAPQNQPTVQPATPTAAATIQPGVDAPPPGVAAPSPEMPAEPPIHCYLKEFTVSPSVLREAVPLDPHDLKTIIKLNVPAPHRMVFHVVTSDPAKITCTDIVIIKNAQTAVGGIKIIWGAIQRDSKFEFKAFSEDDPDTILHGRIYLKKKLE